MPRERGRVDGVTGAAKQAARSLRRWMMARSRAACLAAEAVVPQTDGVYESESGMVLAPSIIEGRPWTTMQESTCHWNTRACALWMGPARSSGKARLQASLAPRSPGWGRWG